MSGRGNPPQGAPSRTILQVPISAPFVDGSGRLTAWGAQFLERLVSYVGPVASSGQPGAPGATVTQQVAAAAETFFQVIGQTGADGATQQSLEDLTRGILTVPLAPYAEDQPPPSAASLLPGGGLMDVFVAGAGLVGGTIENEGTVSLQTTGAGMLVGNPGTAAAVFSDITIGENLFLNGSTLEAINSGSSFWNYSANTSITSGTPPSGDLYWNNATQTSATVLAIRHITNDGIDVDLFLAQITTGSTLIVQDANNSANFQNWTCNGALIIHANSYVEIPVALASSGGTGTTGFSNNEKLFVARFGAAGASGTAGGVLSGTYPNPGFANIAATSLLANSGTVSAAPSAVVIGSGLTLSGGTISATGTGGGGVTSVAESFTGGLISVAGSPITTAGTLALSVAGTSGGVVYFNSGTSWASSAALTANAITLGGGAGGAPSSLGSLGTTTTVLHGNAAGAPSFGPVALATDVSGSLPLANLATIAAGTVLGNPGTASAAPSAVTVSTGLVMSGSTLAVAAGGVTTLAFSGSPTVINSGTVANQVFLSTTALPALVTGNIIKLKAVIFKGASTYLGVGIFNASGQGYWAVNQSDKNQVLYKEGGTGVAQVSLNASGVFSALKTGFYVPINLWVSVGGASSQALFFDEPSQWGSPWIVDTTYDLTTGTWYMGVIDDLGGTSHVSAAGYMLSPWA